MFCRSLSDSEGGDKIKGYPTRRQVIWSQCSDPLLGRDEVTRTNRGAEGIGGCVKFLPLAWAGMPKTSFRKNSDSPRIGDNPVAYCGLKIITSLSLRFPDFQRIVERADVVDAGESHRQESERKATLTSYFCRGSCYSPLWVYLKWTIGDSVL